MHCDSVRDTLLDFSNGETNSFRAWMIRRHLAACADCMAELASVQRFQASLRRADLIPPEPIPAFVSTRRAPLRRTLAAALATVLIGGLFLLPSFNQSRRNTQNPGAAIAAALGRVNTWHFAGWKQIDGKQVPWEVWGRRKPFLYYERVGDLVTWDNGKQRLRVFPPNAALNRPVGLIIKSAVTPTSADVGFEGDPAYQCLAYTVLPVNGTGFGDGFTQLYQQTPEIARFRRQNFQGMSGINENKLYTVGKRDWLPVTYQLHFENPKLSRDTEYLHVDYDDDLPDAVLTPPAPSGYSVIDFTQPRAAFVAGGNIVSRYSLSVQANVIALDKDGNLLIEVHGWLGKNPLTANSTFTLNVGTNVSASNSGLVGEKGNQTIKYLSLANGSLLPGSKFYLPYEPLEPPANAQALPNAFRLSLSVSPELQVRDSDTFGENGEAHPSTQSESLFSENFQWHLAVPPQQLRSFADALSSTKANNLNIYISLLPENLQNSVQFLLNYGGAEQRREYYFVGDDYFYTALWQAAPALAKSGALNPDGTLGKRKADGTISVDTLAAAAVEAVRKSHLEVFEKAKQKFRAKAIYWQKRKLALLPTIGKTHDEREQLLECRLNEMSLLAECYQLAGDMAGRNRTLRQLIRECQPLPEQGGLLRRQAEFTLRIGQFPSDANYKGPS